jgi:DNA-binding GntR family transcriptional regulator
MPLQPSQRKPVQITSSTAHRQPPPNFEISRQTVAGQVLAEIRRRILHGEIPEQLPLPEAPIAESLGVSRVPVREALTTLEHEGLLVPGPRNTLMVRSFTHADWREITAVRLQLEPLAAERAAVVAAPSAIAAMRQNIAAFKDAASPEELAALDAQFHELLCSAAEQPWLRASWSPLRSPFEALLVRSFRAYVAATSLPESKASTADHAGIVDAIETGDATNAARLLRQHINRWQEWNAS